MQFRHEVKHMISNLDMLVLRQRLKSVMMPDSHAKDGRYEIRSLYFDNPDDKALREKLDGVSVRENTGFGYIMMILLSFIWSESSSIAGLAIRIWQR